MTLLLFFSQETPLHCSATCGHLEVTRLLVESKANVAARRCFSPPPSHHLSLTICLAALASLHSHWPYTATKPTSLHTCAASALLNDALPRAAAAQIKTEPSFPRRTANLSTCVLLLNLRCKIISLLLTLFQLAAMATLHSNWLSTATKPKLLHTCAASALLNDAPPRAAPPLAARELTSK